MTLWNRVFQKQQEQGIPDATTNHVSSISEYNQFFFLACVLFQGVTGHSRNILKIIDKPRRIVSRVCQHVPNCF
jgi:hypothetical protein